MYYIVLKSFEPAPKKYFENTPLKDIDLFRRRGNRDFQANNITYRMPR